MAAAVNAPTRISKGSAPTFAATGFAATHSISLTLDGADQSLHAVLSGTTDGSGNITWTTPITLEALGNATWSINDGTTTVAGIIQVWTP